MRRLQCKDDTVPNWEFDDKYEFDIDIVERIKGLMKYHSHLSIEITTVNT